MLDIRLIRTNPEIVIKDLKKRGAVDKLKLVDELIAYDKKMKDITKKADELKHERNVITKEIAELKTKGKPTESKIKTMKEIPKKIKELDEKIYDISKRQEAILMRLPNILHESVPVGKDDSENKEIRKWGVPKKFDFKPKDHIDIGFDLDLIDIERAAKISGTRFYILKNDLVRLEFALMKFGLDFMNKKGFSIIEPPFMIRRKPYEGVTDLGDFGDVIYKIDGEDLYLIATSEHPMASMHMDEVITEKDLPLKYAGISPCFRKEAGAHGRDTKGIFRVHQFNKVEQFVFCKPEESWSWHEKLIKNAEEFFQLLELPYRVVSICTGDIGSVAAKKYDIEVWLPGQNKWREVVSCSNCTDYQARRLNVRYRKNPGDPAHFVHTLNSTLVATQRALVAILENFQQKDGSILVPKALQPYAGFDRIKPVAK